MTDWVSEPGANGKRNGQPLAGLQRFLERPPAPVKRAGEQCELCGQPIAEEHSHLVNIESRQLLCACRPCYLLFVHEGATQGRFRAVPERHLFAPAFRLSEAQWDQLQIPVQMAFFFSNSSLERWVAFYPSPAGATESLLPLDTWQEVLEANPDLAAVVPDVEALLLHRGDERTECYLAPIAACYELVGLVKLHWKGLAGGEAVWREIDAFFANLRDKSALIGLGG